MILNLVVEGISDSEAAKAVVRAAGHETGKVIAKGGKSRLDPDIPKYNVAARWEPWVVFRDTDSVCPVVLRERLMTAVSQQSPRFELRLAHSMTEAWLLADRAGFARFFGVAESRIPRLPEDLPHAKQALLALVTNSRRREIREGMVAGIGESGALYVQLINEFAREHWDVAAAAIVSKSLRRAVSRIGQLATETGSIA